MRKYLLCEIPNIVVAALVITIIAISVSSCAPSLSVGRMSLFDVNNHSTDSSDSRAHARADTHNEAHHKHVHNTTPK